METLSGIGSSLVAALLEILTPVAVGPEEEEEEEEEKEEMR